MMTNESTAEIIANAMPNDWSPLVMRLGALTPAIVAMVVVAIVGGKLVLASVLVEFIVVVAMEAAIFM